MLDRGNHDTSDMQGMGYLVTEEGKIYSDNIFDYDNWEYLDGELRHEKRILRGVSSLIKNEIRIDTFVNVYEYMKNQENMENLSSYTIEGLKLAGLNDEDLVKIFYERGI